MSKRAKNYLLFLVGNFIDEETSDKFTTHIVESITKVVNGEYMKYLRLTDTFLFHFRSKMTKDELESYLPNVLDSSLIYFLINKPKKFVSNINDDLKTHLLDLNNFDISDELDDLDLEEDDNFFHIIERTTDMDKVVESHDLDKILDKISSNGFDSLTPSENNFLKNISND